MWCPGLHGHVSKVPAARFEFPAISTYMFSWGCGVALTRLIVNKKSICKGRFFRRHFFYESLCPDCGDRNYAERIQTADLRGRVALVTGARVERIGYAVALKLPTCRRFGDCDDALSL